MAGETSMAVMIDDQQYYLNKLPDTKSKLVVSFRTRMLGTINLTEFVADFANVASFLKLAYQCVAVYPNLQSKMVETIYQITKVCDNAAVTVYMFSNVSNKVLVDLQKCYACLIDGTEGVAIKIINQICLLALSMSTASLELNKDFDKAANDVLSTLEETMKVRGEQAGMRDEILNQRRKFEESMKVAEVSRKQAEESIEQARKLVKAAQQKEQQIISEGRNLWRQIWGFFSGQDAVNQQQLNSVRQEKARLMQMLQNQYDLRSKALQTIAELSSKMRNATSSLEVADAAIEALHEAVGELKKISDIMLRAAFFWLQMSDYCAAMSNTRIKQDIAVISDKVQQMSLKSGFQPVPSGLSALARSSDSRSSLQTSVAAEMPAQSMVAVSEQSVGSAELEIDDNAERRKKFWLSRQFKTTAVTEYSRWVAFADVFTEYFKQISRTQTDLARELSGIPSRNLEELTANFANDLKKTQEQLAVTKRVSIQRMLDACWDAKIGPIWNNDDAGKKASKYMGARNGVAWTGNWVTTVPGQMSVINICRVRGQTWDVQVGPIWNNDHACQKAQEYLRGHPGHAWTGAWCTTDPGKMSVLRMMKVD